MQHQKRKKKKHANKKTPFSFKGGGGQCTSTLSKLTSQVAAVDLPVRRERLANTRGIETSHRPTVLDNNRDRPDDVAGGAANGPTNDPKDSCHSLPGQDANENLLKLVAV